MIREFLFKNIKYKRLIKGFNKVGKQFYYHPSCKFKGKEFIEIGDNVGFGENCIISVYNRCNSIPILKIGHNVNVTRRLVINCANNITIGNNVLIAGDVFITDFNHGMNPIIGSYLNQSLVSKKVSIQDNVWIGEKCIILPGVTIETGSIIAAGSVVTKNVESYSIYAGNPAKIIKKYSFDKKDWINIK